MLHCRIRFGAAAWAWIAACTAAAKANGAIRGGRTPGRYLRSGAYKPYAPKPFDQGPFDQEPQWPRDGPRGRAAGAGRFRDPGQARPSGPRSGAQISGQNRSAGIGHGHRHRRP